jgi:glycosyltransferase involved in cell wall biosynthesis
MKTLDSLVSIVIPTYNGSRFITETLGSCLIQSYRNIEIIIVIDGSTDNTLETVSNYSDRRIKIVYFQQNRGLPQALNSGFSISNGQYLTWIADDDYYTQDAIECMLLYLSERPDIGLVYTGVWVIDESGKIIAETNFYSPDEITWTNPVGHCFLYRREVAEKVGLYDINWVMVEDVQYWMRVYKQSNMACIKERHYYHRLHRNSLTVKNYGAYLALRKMAAASREQFGMSWISFQHRLADIYIEEAFAAALKNDFRHLHKCLMRGIIRKPSWLRERGIYSIWLRGLLKLPQKNSTK